MTFATSPLECLLKFILDKLGDHPRGIDPSVLIARCAEEITATVKSYRLAGILRRKT